MKTTADWDALVAHAGPLVAASEVSREVLLRAATEGRLFRLVVQRDGYGSGEVSIDVLRSVPTSLGFGAHGAVAWECFLFSAEGALEGIAGAVRYAWESFGDVPGLPTVSRRDSPGTLRGLLREAETPPWALRLAAVDRDAYLRMDVVGNADAPPEALALLARDEDEDVRLVLARHPNCPPAALEILARGADLSAARAVGENPATPPDVLEALASHASASVRFGAAFNPNTPAHVLAKLAQDPDPSVRWRSRR